MAGASVPCSLRSHSLGVSDRISRDERGGKWTKQGALLFSIEAAAPRQIRRARTISPTGSDDDLCNTQMAPITRRCSLAGVYRVYMTGLGFHRPVRIFLSSDVTFFLFRPGSDPLPATREKSCPVMREDNVAGTGQCVGRESRVRGRPVNETRRYLRARRKLLAKLAVFF